METKECWGCWNKIPKSQENDICEECATLCRYIQQENNSLKEN